MFDIAYRQKVVRFGDFEVDFQSGSLSRRGVKVRLRPQLFTVLSTLLEHAGKVVTRDELRRKLWPGELIVDFEVDLNTIIARLREALGDAAENPLYIETLPKRGYRFVGEVSECPAPEPFPRGRVRIVVLPLSNAGGSQAEEYFSDAMTDEIIAALCQVAPGRLAVIARTTAMQYKGTPKDAVQIGRELKADYIVEGGVSRSQNRMTMNLQLIHAADQTHVFAGKYAAEMRDIFKVMNGAASDMAGSIGIAAGPEGGPSGLQVGGRLKKDPTGDLAAYNEYIQARYLTSKFSAEGFASAQEHLKRAIARDPEFALAYDALAEVHWYQGYLGYVPSREAFSAGIIYALRAVEIDSTLGETHALLGEFHKTIEYNWPEVHREMALALQLDPASPLVRLRYAISELMPHGCLREAIAEIQKALESDPLSLLAQGWLGIMLVLAHEWDLAIDQAHNLLQLFPGVFWGHFVLGVAYREQSLYDKAIAALRTAAEVSGGMPIAISWLGLTLGLSGNGEEARTLLQRLHTTAAFRHVPPTSFAWIHLGLKEFDAAFEWLGRAVDECDQLMMPIKTYQFFDPIRADPRFNELLRKMNLEP